MFELDHDNHDKQITEDIKGRTAIIIDNFYKNPDEVRELALSLEDDDSSDLVNGFPGVRGFYETSEVKEKLYDLYFFLCNKHFPRFDEKEFKKNWSKAGFLVNVLNEETLMANPIGIIPHQDWWMSEPEESSFQFGSVIYLNTPDECAGGTNLYSHNGEMSIPYDFEPEWAGELERIEHDIDKVKYVKEKVGGGEPYKCEFEAEMKYNRMVLYQADVLHAQNVDLGMFHNYNRINQPLFM
jgi:hypothetical protein|tara:strand:- start:6 stop:725 length:720 start_codon:yes stop_codon:yes gene_type:complete